MTWEQWAEFRQLEQAPTRVGVCFQNRYNPSVQLLREVLASGKAGKVLRPGFRHLAPGGPLLHRKRLAGQPADRGRRRAD